MQANCHAIVSIIPSSGDGIKGSGLSSSGLFRPAPGGRSGLARERDLQATGGGVGPAKLYYNKFLCYPV